MSLEIVCIALRSQPRQGSCQLRFPVNLIVGYMSYIPDAQSIALAYTHKEQNDDGHSRNDQREKEKFASCLWRGKFFGFRTFVPFHLKARRAHCALESMKSSLFFEPSRYENGQLLLAGGTIFLSRKDGGGVLAEAGQLVSQQKKGQDKKWGDWTARSP